MTPISMQPAKRKIVEDEDDQDRLSQLPVTLLNLILSFLPLKDAAATSILSMFWRKVWLFSYILDFDVYKVFEHHSDLLNPDQMPRQVFEHVEWVRLVLKSHQAATNSEGNLLMLNKLRIRMRINSFCQKMLDEWISYAFSRRVLSLELDFMVDSNPRLPVYNPCLFYDRFKTGFTNLRSLTLAGVNVTGQVISSLLARSPFLESLKVCKSNALKSLGVYGSNTTLKHLEILYCMHMRYLVISDTSIVSLSTTWVHEMILENNPNLVVLRASEWLHPVRGALRQLSDCLSTVQKFTLNTSYEDHQEVIEQVPHLSEMKELTLIVNPLQEDSLICLATLLSLSPNLEKLVLEFLFLCSTYHNRFEPDSVPIKEWKPSKKESKYKKELQEGTSIFPQVKVVEVREYYGDLMEDATLKYVLEHAVAPPEKLVFNPRNLGCDIYPPASSPRFEVETSVAKRAEKLKSLVPSSVEFIVL